MHTKALYTLKGFCYTCISRFSHIYKIMNLTYTYMIAWFKKQNTSSSSEPKKTGGDFLSLATHELRTPLSVIKWYTEMLLDGDGGPLTDDQSKYLKVIQSSNQRAIDLVRALLNVSRLDQSSFSLHPADISMRVLIDQVLIEDTTRIVEKKLDIEIIQKNETVSASLDKQMCLVILRNLISNAILFSHNETKIIITLEEVLSEGSVHAKKINEDSVLVSITDMGIGIPETDKDRIFSKLFKASNAKNEQAEGSGLGLYIVKSAVEALSGSVWFTSLPDGSTTFYIVFPKKGLHKKEGRTVLE